MKNLFSILLCLFIISGCASKKQTRYFDYKNFDTAFAKISDNLYAGITEVSNGEYNTFLNYLYQTDIAKYNAYAVDSSKWRTTHQYAEPLTAYYHSHPAYKDYPLVNITHEAAIAYCNWLTQNYNNKTKRKFKKVVFRLPTENEWKFAARGGKGWFLYPWGGPFLRNSRGSYLANFRHLDESNARDTVINNLSIVFTETHPDMNKVAGALNDDGIITQPTKSYFANELGLYNMAGNVSEMLANKGHTKGGNWNSYPYFLRIDARDEFEGKLIEPSPLVGFRVFVEVIEK